MKRAKVQSSKNLPSLWLSALRDVEAGVLIERLGLPRRIRPETALLFWGKAAHSSAQVFDRRSVSRAPCLIISPKEAGHPFPDARSFEMGARIVAFLDDLGRSGVRDLLVFLSGGASSLAWIKPAGVSESELRAELEELYRDPLTICELNRCRSRLCRLKAGGAARLLRLLAPRVRAKVYVLSDVAPFGVEVVGSGPFADRNIPHRLLADNSTLARSLRCHARLSGEKILEFHHSILGSEISWARDLACSARKALTLGGSGLLIRGGEPSVRLPKRGMRARRGGRQCQIAARLALEFWEEIRRGEVEILCASSDGADANSGAAAAHLFMTGQAALSNPLRRQLKKAIKSYDTARFLARQGFVIPSFMTGTNVQDIVVVRIRKIRRKIPQKIRSGASVR